MREDLLMDANYWQILKKIITREVGADYCIAGQKSAELLLRDFSLPGEILVYTKTLNKRVKVSSDYVVVFRTISAGKRLK